MKGKPFQDNRKTIDEFAEDHLSSRVRMKRLSKPSNSEYGATLMVRHSRLLTPVSLIVAFSAAWLFASDAVAEPNDQAALDLAKKAIEVDYLGTKFAEAKKKLDQALALCGPKSCSGTVVARLHRDLGVIYIGGMAKPEEGKAEFVAALKADPAIILDPDLTSRSGARALWTTACAWWNKQFAPPSRAMTTVCTRSMER
jgi:hypothetical protein